MSERYTITAALPYTNGPIHIGHLAGVYVPADIFARYQRLKNNDVAFICGSDEHGVAISIKAKKEGTTPKQIIDKYHKIIKDSLHDFGISFDNYSRTSLPIHYQTASEFFRTLYDKGDFIEETSEQLYDEQAGQFLADRFVIGTCPKCGNEEAYGDQCERCGTSLNATDLINPKSTLTGSKPVLRETKHWFLPLQNYSEFLEKWIIEGHKNDWKPNVYGQVKSWLDDGLRPRAVTRDLDWGIPVPVEGAEGKVLYVWFDAPIGYISSTKEWAARVGKDWEPYWKDEKTKLIHFIGKDNIVFHCVIFPAMLKAEGSYILPENVPANEFLNLEGNKLSTSKNWAVWLNEYLEDFPAQQDTLRYVITANAPETKDNDFTWRDFQARNNNELVAIYGNFINRVMVLTEKYYKGVVPTPHELTKEDQEIFAQIKELTQKIEQSLERYRFREAQQELMNIARLGNKYLADEEPWKLIKEDPTRVETIMYIALHIATALAVTSEPFLPFTSAKLKQMLNFATMSKAPVWEDVLHSDSLIYSGHTIGKSVLLFEKIEDEAIQKQIDKLENSKKANQQAAAANLATAVTPQKELISYEDFAKMDIRIGTILEAEKMPKADKLLILKVDTGLDQRTIVSGIAQSFDPKEIIGKKVTVLANLAPRKLRGVESHGMILMIENKEGKYVFLNPDAEGIANGTEVK